MDAKTLYKISYGLFVLTSRDGDKDNGCIVNTAIQAASSPLQVSVSVNKANYTCETIAKTGLFTVSILSQSATFELFKRFGFQSGRDADKFAGFSGYERGANGLLYITEGTNAYISVQVKQTVDLGSHMMFVGEVTDMAILSAEPSATYEYYQANIKPKPQAAAPVAKKQTVWRCSICGYEHVGEELPEDFVCPLCKHPASDFEKVEQPAAEEPKSQTVWRCSICGYEHVGEELPEDFVCPLCKHPASDFEKVEQPAAEEPKSQTVWRCSICGYEYVGEELPEDFTCPLCKHPASDFEKVVK